MGFRFRKSFKIMPGVRINVSKTGFSTSVGGKGASYNIDFRGKKKRDPNQPSPPITKGCLLFFGIPAALVLAFFVWILARGGDGPRYRHPATISGNGIRVRDTPSAESYSTIIGSVSTGDTVEVHSISDEWCRISPLESKPSFKGGSTGYILRKYLNIPDSTLQVEKAGKLY